MISGSETHRPAQAWTPKIAATGANNLTPGPLFALGHNRVLQFSRTHPPRRIEPGGPPMDGVHFLGDLLIAFAAAGAGVFLFHRLRAPSVVGLLAAGVLTGPNGLGLVRDPEHIKALAEIGVVVLLFAVGLEFSLPR